MTLQRIFSLKTNAWKLAILAFTSGVIVMSLEIISSRIITPIFGSTTYTWGSLIGVVLSGLSIGYFLGGKIADKNPTLEKISSIIFSCGLFITFLPFLTSHIVEFSIFVLPESIYSSFLATILLLIFPSMLLGFVSPYMIKLGTKTLQKVGNISGNLYSLSTIGSIFGTFSSVYFLLPFFEVSQIIFGLGIVLMICSLIGLRHPPKIFVLGVIMVLFTPWSSVHLNLVSHIQPPLYETETPYSHLDVIDAGNIRELYLDGRKHSAMDLGDPLALIIDYTEFFHIGPLINPDIENVLFVGGGGFSGPKNFLLMHPKIKVDVVEIDPDVINAAKKYFNVIDDPRLEIFNEDARLFLSTTDNEYDLIILDAYAPGHIPYHLLTKEFYGVVYSKLTPNGIVVSNSISSIHGDTSDFFRTVYKTMDVFFPSKHVFLTEDENSLLQNIMLVATKKVVSLERESLLESAKKNSIFYLIDDLEREDRFYESEIITNDVSVLSDDYSSVENLVDPITRQAYIIEPAKLEIGKNINGISEVFTVSLLILIGIFWLLYMIIIWKGNFLNQKGKRHAIGCIISRK